MKFPLGIGSSVAVTFVALAFVVAVVSMVVYFARKDQPTTLGMTREHWEVAGMVSAGVVALVVVAYAVKGKFSKFVEGGLSR